MKRVAMIIPAYNEEDRIGKALESYFDYFGKLKEDGELDFKIIVVLNACKDNTRAVVEEFSRDELVILEFEKGGKGFAIVEGFKYALMDNWELIGFLDADCSTPPNAYYGLIRHIGDSKGIIADRWDRRSLVTPKQNFLRRFISRGYNFIVRSLFLFKYRDTQCGAKLFRRGLLMSIVDKLGSSEWGFDVDLLFYANLEGARIKSIPTEWHDEVGSNIDLKKTPITMFLSAVRLRLVHSPLRIMVRSYWLLPEGWKFHRMF